MRRSLVLLTASILFGACGENDLTVGGVDGAPVSGGTGGATSSTAALGGSGGAGGMGGAGGSAGADAAFAVCDPLAPFVEPIRLGEVVGVGRSADGTIYVVDKVGSTHRVFVSDPDGALVRQRVTGSGAPEGYSVFSTSGPRPPFVIQIDVVLDWGTRIGVMQGTLLGRKSFTVGMEGEELRVYAPESVAGMPLRNLPGEITAEYVAALPNGDALLVTRPTDDGSYADFRLFLGPPSAVQERLVSNVWRSMDGGSTTVAFDLDGVQAQADFPVVGVDGGFAPGPATLTVGDITTPLERLSAFTEVMTYLCR